MNKVKFSVFADLHVEKKWSADGEERLDAILERAKKENVDFIIHCGDLTHDAIKEKHVVDKYNNFEIPTYHVLGNHEMDKNPLKDVLKAYNMPDEYYYFDKNGFRFIVLNANYMRIGEEDIAYCNGNYFSNPCARDYISKKQLIWLEEVIMSSPFPIIIFSHGNLEREDVIEAGGLRNREEFQDVIRKAHANKKRVLMCINGHHHVDYMRIYEHVCYFSVNSATMNWIGTAGKHSLFGEEFHKEHENAQYTVIYNDPIHAVITLSEDGTIEIEGMKSSFFCGVTRGIARGNDCDACIKVTPEVMSEKIILPMEI